MPQETVVHQEILDLLDHPVLSERVVQKDLLVKSVHQDVMVPQELKFVNFLLSFRSIYKKNIY